jgi:hypothetical protein
MIYKNEALDKVLQNIKTEREFQDNKWGSKQTHDNGTGPGEVYELLPSADYAKRLCDAAAHDGELTWAHILLEEVCEALEEKDPVKLRTELVQVAAVCCSFIEDLDRKAKENVIS